MSGLSLPVIPITNKLVSCNHVMLSSYECYAGLSDNDSISSMPYFVQVFNLFRFRFQQIICKYEYVLSTVFLLTHYTTLILIIHDITSLQISQRCPAVVWWVCVSHHHTCEWVHSSGDTWVIKKRDLRCYPTPWCLCLHYTHYIAYLDVSSTLSQFISTVIQTLRLCVNPYYAYHIIIVKLLKLNFTPRGSLPQDRGTA